jgi:hypothetical protein
MKVLASLISLTLTASIFSVDYERKIESISGNEYVTIKLSDGFILNQSKLYWDGPPYTINSLESMKNQVAVLRRIHLYHWILNEKIFVTLDKSSFSKLPTISNSEFVTETDWWLFHTYQRKISLSDGSEFLVPIEQTASWIVGDKLLIQKEDNSYLIDLVPASSVTFWQSLFTLRVNIEQKIR